MTTSPTSLSRRDILLMALSSTAGCVMPGIGAAQGTAAAAADQTLAAMLDAFVGEILALAPQRATSLGLDTRARAALKSRLSEHSAAADAQWATLAKSMLARLKMIDAASLSPAAKIRYQSVLYSANTGVEGLQFSYGGAANGLSGNALPYPVTQQDGAIVSVPEFLGSQHGIANAADAEAYMARLSALSRLLDQETARITEQAGRGIMPSRAIAAITLKQLNAYRATPAAAQKLVTSIDERTRKQAIAGDWQARATRLVETEVYPALERQIAAFTRATANAPEVAGVHRLPDGAAYYQWALKLGTSTNRTPAEIHAIGLEQNRLLQSQIDAILKSQGMTDGSVGERMTALVKDPSRFYADDDAGREQLIGFCNERVAAIRKLMPQLSRLNLAAPLIIKRVPTDIEAGAPLGYMNPASLDGKRPSIYYVNLKSTRLWPKHELSSLTAHEGIPGHTWQFAYMAEHQGQIPLIASVTYFNAFIEGWALYSEQLIDEAGLYGADPWSRIGYLQGQQFRACRLVVDTGLHAMQWSREKAIQFLVENTGRNTAAMTSEIDRYTVMPGQACGYKMGHNEILGQRARARTALGARFDLAGFNDAIVATGGVPLAVLPEVIDQYIAGIGAAKMPA